MAVLISICVATAVISAIMAVCGVMACRRKRAPPPSAPAHWSTHVTVTPDCRNGNSSSGNTRESSMPSQASNGQHRVPNTSNGDRVALIAFADQDPVVLPSYEDALREDRMEGRGPRMMTASGYRQHHAAAHRQRSRHHPGPETHLTGAAGKVYSREQGPTRSGGGAGNRRRPHEPDAVSHSSLGWSGRPQSGSNSASLRSGSVQSVETVGNSEGTNTSNGTETSGASQTPSCRALAGSLASFDTSSIVNTEGVPLLEENEFETEGSGNSVSGDTASAYSETSTKSR